MNYDYIHLDLPLCDGYVAMANCKRGDNQAAKELLRLANYCIQYQSDISDDDKSFFDRFVRRIYYGKTPKDDAGEAWGFTPRGKPGRPKANEPLAAVTQPVPTARFGRIVTALTANPDAPVSLKEHVRQISQRLAKSRNPFTEFGLYLRFVANPVGSPVWQTEEHEQLALQVGRLVKDKVKLHKAFARVAGDNPKKDGDDYISIDAVKEAWEKHQLTAKATINMSEIENS